KEGGIVVKGGGWSGSRCRVRPGMVDHGPNRGLGTSGAPVVSQRARSGIDWSLSGTAEGARIGCHVICDDSDACADCHNPAFGRATRHGAENGHRTRWPRRVVHRLRPAVPPRESNGNPTIKPRLDRHDKMNLRGKISPGSRRLSLAGPKYNLWKTLHLIQSSSSLLSGLCKFAAHLGPPL